MTNAEQSVVCSDDLKNPDIQLNHDSNERFVQIEHNIGNLTINIQHIAKGLGQLANRVLSVQNQMQESLQIIEQASPILKQLIHITNNGVSTIPTNNNGFNGSTNQLPQTSQNLSTPPTSSTSPTPPTSSTPSISPNKGTQVANTAVNIMDKLLQALVLSKQLGGNNNSSNTNDAMTTFMSSMKMGMDMLTSMNSFISGLKSDWIKEQKAALSIMKAEPNNFNTPKDLKTRNKL